MATNLQQDGTTLDWHNTTAETVLSGQPVAVGGLVGVAHNDIPAGLWGVLHTVGVFVLPKVADETWAVGDKVYLDATGALTAKATDGAEAAAAFPLAGSAWSAGEAGQEDAPVRLGF
ncbi:DUF2190 family protein [Serratia marcescens]|uniref:DUF2190 family protein n=1 Tax=Serratia TaxID=613 RepID=UPI000C13C96D|nr:DUF2190 family protein [Serratia marcescens]MDX6807949.1 DUF2190 family protein [Serratia marcescens]PHY87908.1 hypothetical protein CS370_06510 [Serratia marcescens]HBC7448642.1 DUF2190 family protein [Serratia marcescens]